MKKNEQNAHLDLINAVREGNENAFEALLEAYEPLIDTMSRSFANTAEDSESHEDLRQEACIALYKAVQTYDVTQNEISFGLYAKLCVRNRLVSYTRKLRRREPILPLEERIKAQEDVTQGVVAEEAYMELYRRIEAVLSPYENHVWWLYLSGQTTGAIAAQLGKDERSVQNAVYRIRKKLRIALHPNSAMPE
jgi:RNA polymerase sporulation-specific sigma factor